MLGDLPNDVATRDLADGDLDFIHAFFLDAEELRETFADLKAALARDGMLWISWAKKASKIPTDITREIVREIGLSGGLVDVKVGSVDDKWSGLKFVYRLEDR